MERVPTLKCRDPTFLQRVKADATAHLREALMLTRHQMFAHCTVLVVTPSTHHARAHPDIVKACLLGQ